MSTHKKKLVLILLIVFCFSVCPVYAKELSFELIYNGKAYENGQSIHYTGDSVI